MNNESVFTKQNVIIDQKDLSKSFNILNDKNIFLKIFLYKNKEEIKKFILHKDEDEDEDENLLRYLNIICEYASYEDYEDDESYDSIVEYFIESFLRYKYDNYFSNINDLLNFHINENMDVEWLYSTFSNHDKYPFTETELQNLSTVQSQINDDLDDLDNMNYGQSTRNAQISPNPTNNSSLELVSLAINSIDSQTKILQKEQQKLKFSKYFNTYWNILNFDNFERWYKEYFQKKIRFSGKQISIRMQSNPLNGFYMTPNLELFITKEFKIIQIKAIPKLKEILTDYTIEENIKQILNELERKLKEEGKIEKDDRKIKMTLSNALKKQQKRLRKNHKW